MSAKIIQLSDYITIPPDDNKIISHMMNNRSNTIWRKDRENIQNIKRIWVYLTLLIINKYKIK